MCLRNVSNTLMAKTQSELPQNHFSILEPKTVIEILRIHGRFYIKTGCKKLARIMFKVNFQTELSKSKCCMKLTKLLRRLNTYSSHRSINFPYYLESKHLTCGGLYVQCLYRLNLLLDLLHMVP